MANPMDLVASLGGMALSSLQVGGSMAMAVGGAAGTALMSTGSAMAKGLGGEAGFFDESITVRLCLAGAMCLGHTYAIPLYLTLSFLSSPPSPCLPHAPLPSYPHAPTSAGGQNQALAGQCGFSGKVFSVRQGGGHEVHFSGAFPFAPQRVCPQRKIKALSLPLPSRAEIPDPRINPSLPAPPPPFECAQQQMARGRDASMFYPDVVKNVIVRSPTLACAPPSPSRPSPCAH
jgi:hypothetical protein